MLYGALGFVLVAVGLVGAVLPLLPTTIFFILAVPCFARSNARMEAWILDHPQFGAPVRAWIRHGAIPPMAKLMALSGIAIGYGLFAYGARAHPLALGLGGGFMLACAAFVATRPSGPK